MIRHLDKISLQNQPVFTKIGIQTPLNESIDIPSDACYLYIDQGEGHTLLPLPNGDISATSGTVILSACGLTVGKMISEQPKGSMDTIIVHFNRELLEEVFEGEKPELWEEMEAPITQFIVQTAADKLIEFYFNTIHQLFDNKAALTDTLLKLKLKEIILLLLQSDNSESIRQIIKSLFSERKFTFKEMVEVHLFSASIEELALITNCSLSTFKRKFKEIYHTSPGKYVMEKRLEKVAESLRISDEAISNIGYDWGFESPEHLSRAFKRQFGLTPSAYRMSLTVR